MKRHPRLIVGLLSAIASFVANAEDLAETPVTLGFTVESVSDAAERLGQLGAPPLGASRKCVVVTQVDPDGPAAQSLPPNCAITSLNGTSIPDVETFATVVRSLKAGSRVTVKGLYLTSDGRKSKWKTGEVQLTVAREGEIVARPVELPSRTSDTVDRSLFEEKLLRCPKLPPQATPNSTAPPSATASVPSADESPFFYPLVLPYDVCDALSLKAPASFSLAQNMPDPFDPCFLRRGSSLLGIANIDGAVAVWHIPTDKQLLIDDKKVTSLYRPLALAPDHKRLISSDGQYIRIWNVTSDQRLELVCSSRVSDTPMVVEWIGNDSVRLLLPESRQASYFTLTNNALSLLRDPLADEQRIDTLFSSELCCVGMPDNMMIRLSDLSFKDGSKRGQFLTKTTLIDASVATWLPVPGLDSRLETTTFPTPCRLQHHKDNGPIAAPLPTTPFHCFDNGRSFVIAIHTEEALERNRENYAGLTLVCCDAATLLPTRTISLSGLDRVASVSEDGNLLAVLRTTSGRTAKAMDLSFAVFIYDLRTGSVANAFGLGDAFNISVDLKATRDKVPEPTLAFSKDSQRIYCILNLPATRESLQNDNGKAGDCLIAMWDIKTAQMSGPVVRKGGAIDWQSCGIAIKVLGDRLCSCIVEEIIPDKTDLYQRAQTSRSTHVFDIEDLIAAGALITEGHVLRSRGDLEGAYAKYHDAMSRRYEWFFREHYPVMLNTAVDMLSSGTEIDKGSLPAKTLVSYLRQMNLRVISVTDGGKALLKQIEEEELAEEVEKMQADAERAKKGAEEFAKLRERNKAKKKDASRLTTKQFIEHLDACKDEGVMNTGVTILRFFDFAFEDTVGDPDQMLNIKQGESEYAYECTDGVVWCTVSGDKRRGLTVITRLEVR